MLEELEIRNLGPIRSAVLTPAPGMTAITGETGAGKSMLLNAIRLISGAAADANRVSSGADAAWAQGVFMAGPQTAAAAIAAEAGVEPEDGELFLARSVPASGRSRATANGRSVPRSVLGRITDELVTVHGQADQLRIASAARQREFLDAVAGDQAELASYRQAWEALAAMDERLEKLASQESSIRQQADYLRESIERINRVDPQPGEDEDLKTRRSRIENAAEIAQGVGGALGALDASAVDGDPDALGASDLITRAVQHLRAIHVEGPFSDLADRLESIGADLSDVVFSLSRQIDVEEGVDDLDAINGRIHELDELTRRWGPTLADVIAWRDRAANSMSRIWTRPRKRWPSCSGNAGDCSPPRWRRPTGCRACAGVRRRNCHHSWGRSCPRWRWPARDWRSASRRGRRTRPEAAHGRWTPTDATTSRSCSPRSPVRRSCRWAEARRAAS